MRFICGTQDLHKRLEERISQFYQTEDTILYSSCFDANGGLFESLLGTEDAIITDALNHASIIDGIRLCKAKRFIYEHSDMQSLENALKKAREGMDIWDGPGLDKEPVPARNILIATDGVFSMDGDIADVQRHHRAGQHLRRAGHGRRFPRHRLSGPDRPRRHRDTTTRSARWTSSPPPWARPWAAPPAASPAAAAK